MSLAEIKVDVDQEEVKNYIYSRIDDIINETLLFWDINVMVKRMSMSKSFIEEEFLTDPRMKILERRKHKGKRIWPYKKSLEVIQDIMDEW